MVALTKFRAILVDCPKPERREISMTTETDLQAGLLKVAGSMSIYETAALRDVMLAVIDSPKGLTLDLGDVAECDTAGVQLLCSACITARKRGKPFHIHSLSNAVTEAMEGVGLPLSEFLNP